MQEYADEVPGYDAATYAQPGMDFVQPGAAGAVMDAPQVRSHIRIPVIQDTIVSFRNWAQTCAA